MQKCECNALNWRMRGLCGVFGAERVTADCAGRRVACGVWRVACGVRACVRAWAVRGRHAATRYSVPHAARVARADKPGQRVVRYSAYSDAPNAVRLLMQNTRSTHHHFGRHHPQYLNLDCAK